MGIVPKNKDKLDDVGIATMLANWETRKRRDFIELLEFAAKRPKLYGVEVIAILKTAEQFGLDTSCIIIQSSPVGHISSVADANRIATGIKTSANDVSQEKSVPLCETIIIHMEKLNL